MSTSRSRGRAAALALATAGALALSSPSAVTAATTPAGVVYGGTTSQGQPIVIATNPARKRVSHLKFLWRAKCTLDPSAPAGTETTAGSAWTYSRIPVSASGSWKAVETNAETFGDGSRWTYTFTYAGRRIGGKMVGTVVGSITETSAAGATVRVCATGKIAFSIADRQTYGEVSTNSVFAYLSINPAGTRVTALRWYWSAQCVLGPAARPDTFPETFEVEQAPRMAITKGKFGGTFDTPSVADPATGVTYRYTLIVSGRKVGAEYRGTLRAKLVETDTATGQSVRTCTSPKVTYRFRD